MWFDPLYPITKHQSSEMGQPFQGVPNNDIWYHQCEPSCRSVGRSSLPFSPSIPSYYMILRYCCCRWGCSNARCARNLILWCLLLLRLCELSPEGFYYAVYVALDRWPVFLLLFLFQDTLYDNPFLNPLTHPQSGGEFLMLVSEMKCELSVRRADLVSLFMDLMISGGFQMFSVYIVE